MVTLSGSVPPELTLTRTLPSPDTTMECPESRFPPLPPVGYVPAGPTSSKRLMMRGEPGAAVLFARSGNRGFVGG
jgi:hypothetical protein